MPALQFTRDLALLILRGRKDQTLRAKLPPGIALRGPLTMLNGYHPGNLFGRAIVAAFDFVHVSALTALDARRDGFATLELLHERLVAMKAPARLWRIRWRDFVPSEDGQRLSRPT